MQRTLETIAYLTSQFLFCCVTEWGDPSSLTLYRADHVKLRLDFSARVVVALGSWDEGNQFEISHSDLNEDYKTTRPHIVACCDTIAGYFKGICDTFTSCSPTSTTKGHSQ